ncbi:MAG: hypothetical protein SFX73_25755 [Kofleriaceae bacterium]|nr:hypothetical protein [Kofleriaceae bacterium]
MAKLAMISALLLGACVATDTTEDVAKVTDDAVTPINVVDEVELPTATPDYGDFGTVVITGVQIPGRESTAVHIDLGTALEIQAFPYEMEFCAIADTLDSSDVCSSLCDPDGFSARVNPTGGAGCSQQSCQLGDTLVNLEVCSPSNP